MPAQLRFALFLFTGLVCCLGLTGVVVVTVQLRFTDLERRLGPVRAREVARMFRRRGTIVVWVVIMGIDLIFSFVVLR